LFLPSSLALSPYTSLALFPYTSCRQADIPCRKLNQSPAKLEDKEVLAKFLVTPPIKKIDLHFPLGLEVTARNMKGVTIKDALDAIYKQFKKKVTLSSLSLPPSLATLLYHSIVTDMLRKKDDDELGENPYLAGFEWDREECYTKFIVHQKKTGEEKTVGGGKKSKKNKADKIEE